MQLSGKDNPMTHPNSQSGNGYLGLSLSSCAFIRQEGAQSRQTEAEQHLPPLTMCGKKCRKVSQNSTLHR